LGLWLEEKADDRKYNGYDAVRRHFHGFLQVSDLKNGHIKTGYCAGHTVTRNEGFVLGADLQLA
jgi:hypothetical protein